MILALLVSSALSAPVPTRGPSLLTESGWALPTDVLIQKSYPNPTKTPVYIEVLMESWENNARAAIAWDELQRKRRAGLVFIVTATVTAPVPTNTPIGHEVTEQALQTAITRDDDRSFIQQVVTHSLPRGAWVVTSTAIASPSPNAEATCVARGHDWVTDGSETAPYTTSYRVTGEVRHGVLQWCHRCHLWREKP